MISSSVGDGVVGVRFIFVIFEYILNTEQKFFRINNHKEKYI
jgi:hypothetical protein